MSSVIERMSSIKRTTNRFTPDDLADVTLKFEGHTLYGFAINYRARIKEEWHEVYRVDTEHGYLHEQRYWISPEPRHLKNLQGVPMKTVFKGCWNGLRENWTNYRKNMEKKLKGDEYGKGD